MGAEGEAGRWMVVGLGNPGTKYRNHRHNVGFMVVDLLCERAQRGAAGPLAWRSASRFSAELAIGELSRQLAVLVKPQTYMNLSGRAVGPLASFYRVTPERLVVIHDDVDLELGRLKVKQGGGDAGHNGLRSLTEALGSADYIRVRCGVGRPERGEVADYVLSDFAPDEAEAARAQLERAAKAVHAVVSRGLKEAMNRFNRPPKPPKPPAEKGETVARQGLLGTADVDPGADSSDDSVDEAPTIAYRTGAE